MLECGLKCIQKCLLELAQQLEDDATIGCINAIEACEAGDCMASLMIYFRRSSI